MRVSRKRKKAIAAAVAALCVLAVFLCVIRGEQQAERDAALVVALEKDNLADVRALLDRGADPNAEQILNAPSNPTLLEQLSSLWDTLRGQPRPRVTKRFRPSIVLPFIRPSPNAAPIAALLLERGANPNATDRSGLNEDIGKTALMLAATNRDLASVEILLKHKADPNSGDGNSRTALMNADAREGRLLIEHGADCNARDSRGDTPLMKAVGRGDSGLVTLLLDHGAGIDRADSAGSTPLMFSCILFNTPMMKLLIDRGADVDAVDNNGNTAVIHVATTAAAPEQIEMLLRHGAKARTKDKSGRTALDYAKRYAGPEALSILKDAMDREALPSPVAPK